MISVSSVILAFLNYEDTNMQVVFIGQKDVGTEELAAMQEFHRAVFCLQASPLEATARDEHGFFPLDCPYKRSRGFPVSFEAWTASSSGSWYVAFPVLNHNNTACSEEQQTGVYCPVYVAQSAREATIFVNNLLHRVT
jgi:hypothetical protein